MTSVSFVAKCGKVFYMEYKITLMHEQQNILCGLSVVTLILALARIVATLAQS